MPHLTVAAEKVKMESLKLRRRQPLQRLFLNLFVVISITSQVYTNYSMKEWWICATTLFDKRRHSSTESRTRFQSPRLKSKSTQSMEQFIWQTTAMESTLHSILNINYGFRKWFSAISAHQRITTKTKKRKSSAGKTGSDSSWSLFGLYGGALKPLTT